MSTEGPAPEPLRVVGIGADGPSGLGPRARDLVAQADVLAGGHRHLAWFPDHPAERLALAGGLRSLDRLEGLWRAGRRAVVLASGDPGFFGVAAALRARFGTGAVEVLPAVSSVQLAFARAGLSWEGACFLSAHGRPLDALVRAVLASAAPAFGLLTDGVSTPPRIADALRAAGMADCRAVVGEHLGAEGERVLETTLHRLADRAGDACDPLSVLVVDRSAAGPAVAEGPAAAEAPAALEGPAAARAGRGPRPAVGRPESDYEHARGLVTKSEARAVGLARLSPAPGEVVWDVGAGCGSVAVEAAALARGGRVYAVERDPEQLGYLAANRSRFGAENLEIVAGEAPECLAGLPDPAAVFLGGSGSRQRAILECLGQRLSAGGRLVAHFATLEGLAGFAGWADEAGWPCDVVQLAVSRGRRVAGAARGPLGLRFVALDPVWVVRAVRPA